MAAASGASAQYAPPTYSGYPAGGYRQAPPPVYGGQDSWSDDEERDYDRPPQQPAYRVDQGVGSYSPPPRYDDRAVYGSPPDNRRFDERPYDRRYDQAPRMEEAARPAPGIERHDLRPPADVGPQPLGPQQSGPQPGSTIASLPPDDQPETGEPRELPPQFRRQLVDYQTKEPVGTIRPIPTSIW
jgi:hypothetical protein